MRAYLLATAMVALPIAAFAQSHCALPAPVTMTAEAPIKLPPPVTVGGAPVPLMPTAPPVTVPSDPAPPPRNLQPTSIETASQSPADLVAIPALAHIAAAGATLSDLGLSHGLHTVSARNGAQVMVFEVSPDGQAAVAGLMTDLSVDQLRAIGGKELTELPPQHGLRALFLHNGPQFQVFYASPDNQRVIPGVMWDAAGKDVELREELTRDLH